MFKRIGSWARVSEPSLENRTPALTIGQHIDAADYELQSILRDVAKVGLSRGGHSARQIGDER